MVVDTYQLGLVESKEILERCGKVAVIDHHRKGVGFIEHADLVCHEPYSSSASELVTELLQYVGERDDKPNRVEAEGLLAGILLDTQDFTLHTGVRTFEAAAALRRYGAETERVRQLFDVTMVEYNAKADLVEAAQMYRSCAISVSGEVPPEARVAIAQAANDLLTHPECGGQLCGRAGGERCEYFRPQSGGGQCSGHHGKSGRRRPSDHGGGPAQAYHPRGQPGHASKPPSTSTVRARRSHSPKMNLNPEKREKQG